MKKNLLFTSFFTIFTILLFININLVKQSAINSIFMWRDYVFPSLFIMFIIQDLLINYDASTFLHFIFHNLFYKLFGLSENGTLAFILSLLSGSPTNAYTINELYSKNLICKNEANQLLGFSYFANPLFSYTMLMLIFNNQTITIKIIISLYLSNLIYAFATKKEYFTSKKDYICNKLNFGKLLTNSIKKSINTLIMILGSITFFMILSSILNIYFNNIVLINGIFEIT